MRAAAGRPSPLARPPSSAHATPEGGPAAGPPGVTPPAGLVLSRSQSPRRGLRDGGGGGGVGGDGHHPSASPSLGPARAPTGGGGGSGGGGGGGGGGGVGGQLGACLAALPALPAAVRSTLGSLLTPPFLAIVAALCFSTIPGAGALLVGRSSVLHSLALTMELLGGVTIPFGSLLVGAKLWVSRGLLVSRGAPAGAGPPRAGGGGSRLDARSVLAVVVARMLIMPVVGTLTLHLVLAVGLMDRSKVDPLMLTVMAMMAFVRLSGGRAVSERGGHATCAQCAWPVGIGVLTFVDGQTRVWNLAARWPRTLCGSVSTMLVAVAGLWVLPAVSLR